MSNNLVDTAINCALNCKWKEAIEANKEILKNNPEDTEALNRLARAYCECGDLLLAKKTSAKTLKIDPNDQIALKALEKYKKRSNKINDDQNIKASDFIEESGTTRQANLINIAQTNVVSSLDSGDEVIIDAHSHRVAITTLDKKYIGRLTDDLSAIIKKLIARKYQFRVLIKSASKDAVKIFIKEVKRGKGYENVKSFPNEISESFSELSS